MDDNLAGRIRVSVVATGIDTPVQLQAEPSAPGPRLVAVGGTPQSTAAAPRIEAPRPEQRPAQAATAQAGARFPVGMGAAAVAYAPQEEEEEQVAQPVLQASQPRPVQQHPLFTQQAAAPESAPQPHRGSSLFGMVTGGWRRAPQPQQAEMPDLRSRPEPRFAAEHNEPTAQVRAAIAEPEPQGLDIPAFLRRQDSGR